MMFQRSISKARRKSAENSVSYRRGGLNPRYGAITLGEYRLSYPRTAQVQTITQSGMLGSLLERLRRKDYRSALRRAKLERFLQWVVGAYGWLSENAQCANSALQFLVNSRRDRPYLIRNRP